MESSLGGLRLTLVAAFGVVFAAVASGQTFMEFMVPTANSFPGAIAAGPDGALWFTLPGPRVDKIGRITTAGVITEFTIPTIPPYGSLPTAIAAGPDGALWFTESSANKIGRITADESGNVQNGQTGSQARDRHSHWRS